MHIIFHVTDVTQPILSFNSVNEAGAGVGWTTRPTLDVAGFEEERTPLGPRRMFGPFLACDRDGRSGKRHCWIGHPHRHPRRM